MRMGLLLLLAAVAPSTRSEIPPARFELAPSQTRVLLGTPVEISGQASFPESYSLLLDAKGQDSGAFEILDMQLGRAEVHNGLKTQALRLSVAAFDLGEQTLPALRWTLQAKDGARGELTSPPVRLNVLGPKPGPGDSDDIRDIHGPWRRTLWPWLLAAAAAAAAALWAFRRRSTRQPASQPPPDRRTAEEAALEALTALPGLQLPLKEFYDRLSDILREYLARRFGLPALQLTTSGLQRRMIRSDIDPSARAMTKALLERCDLVKFARFLPASEESLRDCETAKGIVRQMRPLETTAP